MRATIPTHLAPGKRQKSNQGDVREVDRTIERAPWVGTSGRILKLIRDEEDTFDKSLPSNRYRRQEKDRCEVPQLRLSIELLELGLLPPNTAIQWEETSVRREGKEFWTCQLRIGTTLCGTEDREWECLSAAKFATALEALAFLQQQQIARENCQMRDNSTKDYLLIDLWPKPFDHEARRSILTQVTSFEDMDVPGNLLTCLRDDTVTRKTGAADLEALNPEDSAFGSVYPFEARLAGSKRTSDGQLKAPSVKVSIRRGCTKVLSVVVNVVEGKIPVATELDCADTMPPQGNSSESHVCERVIPDIEQVALYFDNLMITKSPNEYYAEVHQIFLSIQKNAELRCGDTSQTDELAWKLIWCLLNAYELVSSGGGKRTWILLEKIIRDMNMPGSAEYHNVLNGFLLNMQEISANGGHATPQSDELTSKLVRCLLAAYEQVSEGGEIRVWNLLEGIAQNANTSEYARYHATLRDLYLHIRQNAANAGIEAAQVDDVITSKLVHDFLAAYEQFSHGGSTRVWQILENAVHDIRSLNSDQQSSPAGEFANFGYDPSQSTAPTDGFDELVVCDSVMSESTPMDLGGGNTVHSVDQVLPTQNKTPKTSVPASAQSLPHGQPSTNLLALQHYAHSAADPSGQHSNTLRPTSAVKFSLTPPAKASITASRVMARPVSVAARLGGVAYTSANGENSHRTPSPITSYDPTPSAIPAPLSPFAAAFLKNSGSANSNKPGDRTMNRGQATSARQGIQAATSSTTVYSPASQSLPAASQTPSGFTRDMFGSSVRKFLPTAPPARNSPADSFNSNPAAQGPPAATSSTPAPRIFSRANNRPTATKGRRGPPPRG